jgi:hypothetical protein
MRRAYWKALNMGRNALCITNSQSYVIRNHF